MERGRHGERPGKLLPGMSLAQRILLMMAEMSLSFHSAAAFRVSLSQLVTRRWAEKNTEWRENERRTFYHHFLSLDTLHQLSSAVPRTFPETANRIQTFFALHFLDRAVVGVYSCVPPSCRCCTRSRSRPSARRGICGRRKRCSCARPLGRCSETTSEHYQSPVEQRACRRKPVFPRKNI